MKRAPLTIRLFAYAFVGLPFALTPQHPARGNGAAAIQTTKPVVLVQGEGNASVLRNNAQTAVNKHDQTMEMVQDFMRDCPGVELTLDPKESPDYFVSLNREGAPTIFGEIGRSQIMVLDGHSHPIYTSQKSTVKNAVKGACNSIAADWQATGRLAPLHVANPAPVRAPAETLSGQPERGGAPAPDVDSASPAVEAAPVVKADVALVVRTTARGDKYFKAKTVASIQSDLVSYLTAKGIALGTIETSGAALVLIVDRPISKWVEITMQEQVDGAILWSEKISDGGWGHLGDTALINVLDKVHGIIDARLQGAAGQATATKTGPKPTVVENVVGQHLD